MSAATPARWFCAVAEAFQSAELLCRLYRTGGGQVEHTFINEGHESCGARRLVDPSALVVERDADGNWKLPQDTDRDKWHHGLIASVLDDLAAAARREAST